ncbi:hypothetical protein [Sulfobacillus thermotolerans]|uniref:hypothetical protein n=1 Tax=Sulfobacillus thermotolerans TaxID=338644 RepID=UPI003368EC8A
MPDWKSLKDKAMNAVSNAAQEVDHQLALTKLRAAVNQAQATRDRALARLGQLGLGKSGCRRGYGRRRSFRSHGRSAPRQQQGS